MKAQVIAILLLLSLTAVAQVSEIKEASRENTERSGNRSGRSGDSGGSFFLVDIFINGVGEWQRMKLQADRVRYPSMVSTEIMLQGAIQPSRYYVVFPRIRGNWGLFSTDFRMNYLIEEELNGFTHIRTNDWQILQVNIITSRFLTFKAGTGLMTEAFESRRSFNESAFLFGVHAPDQTRMLVFEYRFSKDWNTGANPRRELSAHYQHQLISTGVMHINAAAGVVYQKYYNSIEVWGVQAGIVFRFFRQSEKLTDAIR